MAKVNRVLRVKEGRAEIVEKPYPKIVEGFVLVKQHIAPICTEQRVYAGGPLEWFEKCDGLGHEGVGEIVEIAPGSRFKVGDRVIIFQGWPCGDCLTCAEGLGATHCENLRDLDAIEKACGSESGGYGFSQYRIAPEHMVQKIPGGLSYKHASAATCLVGCTFTAVVEQDIGAQHFCLVGGVGFIGLATVVNLKYRNAKVIALGRNQHRMQKALELGADHVVNPDDPGWLDQVKACVPGGRGVDFAFEGSGYPYYQRKCIQSTRPYGVTVLLGYVPAGETYLEIHTERDIGWPHRIITSSFDVRFQDRIHLIELLQDPWIQDKIDGLITHQIPMSRAGEAFRAILAKQALKVHLLPQK